MSRGFTDWTDLGIFPLQDVQEGVPVGMRMSMVAGRVKRRPDPGENGESLTEYAREDGLGTLGDIHPWFFWQTSERENRDMGSWSMAWGTIVTSANNQQYGWPVGVQPLTINERSVINDTRYKIASPAWQSCLPYQPKGMLAMLIPSTDEEEPGSIMLNGDRRLVSAGVGGPGASSTTIVDLQPDAELCMDGSSVPGRGGRHARLDSLVRVIALNEGSSNVLRGPNYNSLAINYGTSQQDGILGYGMVFGPGVSGGGGGVVTGSQSSTPSSPITPGASITRGSKQPPPPGAPNNGSSANSQKSEQKSVADFGTFQSKARSGHAIGMMSASASGPIGFGCGKHTLGYDKDGHRITSAHIMTDAYFYQGGDRDGPLMFEGDYPEAPEEHAIPTIVHLSWDSDQKHNFVGGQQGGKWRWWTTVPYVEAQGGGNTGPTTPGTGGGGVNPGPGDPTAPGRPGDPTGPTRPGPGGGTGGPTTPPGGGGSGPNSPIRPGNPPGPPITPGGPTTPGSGSGPSSPITPGAPFNPPPNTPVGPITPQRPISQFAIQQGGSVFSGRGTKPADLDDLPVRFPAPSLGPAGVITKVGGSARNRDVGLYSILHPFNTGFGAISFRPQLWIKGAPNFEHNPLLNAQMYKAEERTRPSVISIRAFGAQSQSGDWDYAIDPISSRARGGMVKGGILISPAEFEMEDYLGINSSVDTDSPTVNTFVTFAPTVGAAFGKPTTTGRPSAYSKLIRQNTATGKLVFSEFTATTGVTDIAKMTVVGTQGYLEVEGTGAMKIPNGVTGTRPAAPATGMLRLNTTTNDLEYYNGSAWVSIDSDAQPSYQDNVSNVLLAQSPSNYTTERAVAIWTPRAGDITSAYLTCSDSISASASEYWVFRIRNNTNEVASLSTASSAITADTPISMGTLVDAYKSYNGSQKLVLTVQTVNDGTQPQNLLGDYLTFDLKMSID